jgi:predicted DNA-binding ribbon-helix-helix protein
VAETARAASSVVKHSLMIAGHRTSVSLEVAFWAGLKAAATRRGIGIGRLVAEIDGGRGAANLSSAIRVFVLEEAQALERSV